MLPVLAEIGNAPLHTFGVMVALAFIAAMLWCRREAIRLGYPVTKIMDMVFWTMIIGLIGARLAFIVVNWDNHYAQNPGDILRIWTGGLVWYGGFVLATPLVAVMAWRHRLPPWATLDLFAPGLMLGLSFGRLGCLAAGDDHGRLVLATLGPQARELARRGMLFNPDGRLTQIAHDVIHTEGTAHPWWTLSFGPQSLVQRDLIGLPLYPTQPIMSAYTLGLFALLVVWRRRRRFDGQLFAMTLIVYAFCRFWLEAMRGDLGRGFWLPGLSTSQGISLAVFAAGIGFYMWLRKLDRHQDPCLHPHDEE